MKNIASGQYANQMAKHGFVALAFDPSYTGEAVANKEIKDLSILNPSSSYLS
jgi:hypothetical protein